MNIPKIRFPGFGGQREEKKLGELYKFITTNSLSRENLNYIEGNVKNIHYGDIHTKFNTIFDITKEKVPFINLGLNKNFNEENFLQNKDIIFADASEDYSDIGKSIEIQNTNNEKVVSGLHTLHARNITNKIKSGFMGYYLKNQNIRKQIEFLAQGIKVLGISATNLQKINIFLPTLEEQKKIADFLFSVDEKINNLANQLEKWKEYKKGIMQKIFSQKIRFKKENGENFDDWQEKKLGEIFKILTFSNKETEENGNYYLASMGNVDQNGKIILNKKTNFEGDFLNKLELIMPTRDIGNGLVIGKVGIVKQENIVAGANLYVLRLKIEGIISFFYYLINSDLVNKSLGKKVQRGVVLMINKSEVENEILKVPSFEEQEKISEFLSSIDEKIENIEKQLEKSKTWKKGLLQNLFV